MKDEHGQFDDEFSFEVSDEFSADLKTLFGAKGELPGHVDRAVMRHGRKRLTGRSSRLAVLRWVGCAAAAIAVVAGVYLYNPAREGTPAMMDSVAAFSSSDIDLSGEVDIIDAFKLARHIESDGPFEDRFDINSDGLVDQRDVDVVAFAAVDLKGVKP